MSEMVHLHVHTQYSLLDGAAAIDRLAQAAKDYAMPAMAITDHGVMYGAFKFYQSMIRSGIKPIIGCEVYVAKRSRLDKTPKIDEDPYHLVLLAQNEEGYANLLRLVSIAQTEGFYYRPRVDRELLIKYHRGLIALSACLAGEVATHILQDKPETAKETAIWYREIFGDRYYLELQDHGIPEQRKVNLGLKSLGKELGIPHVATNDVHYLRKGDANVHDALLCIQTGKTLNDTDRMRFSTDQFYLKNAAAMKEALGGEVESIRNTLVIAERCDFKLETGRHLLPEYKTPDGSSPSEYLRAICQDSLLKLYGSDCSAAMERLDYELRVIESMGFPGYFLVVWDLIRFAKSREIMVGPGRGSAAGSIVAYLLGITTLDPLRYGLLFERFLNPERISMPDIDMDFCYERRGEVIAYVREKYGDDRVAQIVTFGTMAARAAVRDVGRVMGFPYGDVDRLAKLIPQELGITLEQAVESSSEMKKLINDNPKVKNLLEIAQAVEGFPRHASTHAAGVVISPQPLTNYLPLARSSEGEITTQYPMEDIEQIGLLKMDFLGLRTLTVIRDTQAMIQSGGRELNLGAIPLRDEATANLLRKGQTLGVFQLESGGMRRLLIQLRPEAFEDLIPLVALYRPGPLGSGMAEDFIQRRHGERTVIYPHSMLEDILKDTYGIILYQEQVMQICNVMGGFSLGEADLVRRAMGKKKPEVLASMRQKFIDGAQRGGVSHEKAGEVFDLMEYFAGYGFNKSHSAAYARIVYETAFLKAHYPREFMAALLTSVMGSGDKVALYIEECRRMGLRIYPPDINHSLAQFAPEGEGIRFGLLAVKNLGEGAIHTVIAERQKAPYISLYDFCQRIDSGLINRRVIESMVRAGVFSSTKKNRRQMLDVLEDAYEQARRPSGAAKGQMSFFDLAETEFLGSSEEYWPELDEFPLMTLLAMEKEYLGVYLSGHPLDPWRDSFAKNGITPLVDLEEDSSDREVIAGGVVASWKRMTTKAGKGMATFRLEDHTGTVEVLVFPKLYESLGDLNADQVVVVKGRLDAAEEGKKILAAQVRVLEEKK